MYVQNLALYFYNIYIKQPRLLIKTFLYIIFLNTKSKLFFLLIISQRHYLIKILECVEQSKPYWFKFYIPKK